MSKSIYLDYAAATPLDRRVLVVMQPFFTKQFFNPSSSYQAAKSVRQAIADARARVAHWLGSKPNEIIFTAGATESVNAAIHGVMRRWPKAHMVVGATDHDAVLAAAKLYNHSRAPVLPDGTIDTVALKSLITDTTVLVSIGYANNEVGTVQPLRDITALLQEIRHLRRLKNNPHPLFVHTDASQAGCFLDLHVNRLGVDIMSLNGAKMYGPKQTGVLFVKAGVELEPLIAGGGQESGIRSGTENVAGIVGFATALDIAQTERREEGTRLSLLRDQLQHVLTEALSYTVVNGNHKRRLPNNLHVSWPGIDGERLLMMLDEQGVMVSTGSACAANKQTASHVLQALGLDASNIRGSLRLTLGRQTTEADITAAAKKIINAVRMLK